MQVCDYTRATFLHPKEMKTKDIEFLDNMLRSLHRTLSRYNVAVVHRGLRNKQTYVDIF
jgi:hypothetical protein